MKLSSRGDYAVRALVELAAAGDGRSLTVAELAERTAIAPKYLEALMRQLGTAGIVRGRRGPSGGYHLERPAEEIFVGEVIRVMDGPLAPTLCASRTQHAPCPAYRCADEETCTLREMWVEVRDAISAVVDRTTFATLAERTRINRERVTPRYAI